MKIPSATKKGPGRRPFSKADTPKENRKKYGAWASLAKIRKLIFKGKK